MRRQSGWSEEVGGNGRVAEMAAPPMKFLDCEDSIVLETC